MTTNPVVRGSLSLLAGNLLGSSVDTLIRMLKDRANITEGLPLNSSTKAILDNLISIVLQVGALGLGTHFVSNAFPWMTEDPGSFTLWIIGISNTSNTLRQSIQSLNENLSISLPSIQPQDTPDTQ